MRGPAIAILLALLAGLAEADEPIYTPGQGFEATSRFVGTSLFHWYTPDGGQTIGPWLPEEGRENWTGDTLFWQRQIKDIMDANIDVIYVHLWRGMEGQRINLFIALSQLRGQGYDTPKVAPFLDTQLVWLGNQIDLATTAGKDEFANEYIRFFEQYFEANTDAYAESYLAHIDDKVMLNVWHMTEVCFYNPHSLTRDDLESRLSAALGGTYPSFNNGVYMVGSGNPCPWFDEDAYQFAGTLYYLLAMEFNNKTTATIRGGYWDELIRDPGRFVPRDGGSHYHDAWDCLNAIKGGGHIHCSAFSYMDDNDARPIYHAIAESWNEYCEGTGIFAVDVANSPVIPPTGHDDVWSATNNPREYIDRTASGSAAFNSVVQNEAAILSASVPTLIPAGQARAATVVVRNEGDSQWSAAQGFKLAQWPADPVQFAPGQYLIDDEADEIPKYGGVFRGRPKSFTLSLAGPAAPGTYQAHWQMVQGTNTWFGEVLTAVIEVAYLGDFDFDNDVDQADFGHLQACLSGSGIVPNGPGCGDADLDLDQDVDRDDVNLFLAHRSGAGYPPSSP